MTKVMEQTSINFQEIRADLEHERARLLKQSNPDAQQKAEYYGRNPNRDDLANSYTTFGQQSVLQTMDQKKLDQIDIALQRMDEGVYGRCAGCGAAIEPERLSILPTAIHCVDCQQRAA
ncbi:MAG: TraR/DksA family transcriptional regulator [Caldilineaceae bacterium]